MASLHPFFDFDSREHDERGHYAERELRRTQGRGLEERIEDWHVDDGELQRQGEQNRCEQRSIGQQSQRKERSPAPGILLQKSEFAKGTGRINESRVARAIIPTTVPGDLR